jgi:hypothetical protein
MTRRKHRRDVAELSALANSDLKLSEVDPLQDGWTCDCTACRLLRSGVCLQCASRMTAQIIQSRVGATISVSLCSDACREGVERYVATRRRA